jgi:adenine-specific DNA-methyltransferase
VKFNSNFQWSTTSRDVKDGNAEHITREPEQVKAFATPGAMASTPT